MYCLTNVCYVCLEKKDKSLVNINRSLLMNKDIIHIIGYLPFNLAWLDTKRIILICEERLRETYHFLAMCLKNSSLLQGYMDKLNTASISNTDNEAELHVELNNKHNDINKIKCEIKLEDEEIYTVEAIIEETEDENIDDSFVKKEDTWKREEVIDKEECPMDNNSTESRDNETCLEIFVNNNIHDTETDSDSSRFKSTQLHTSNKQEPNTAAKKLFKCLTCSKSFSTKTNLQIHTRVHTGEKPYNCATCKKCFARHSDLVCHMRTHTGEKPYKCTTCKKCFVCGSHLVRHMRTHTGEKLDKCTTCQRCFAQRSHLVSHMRAHTGERPYKCTTCNKCFTQQSALVVHIRTHTGDNPYKCSRCKIGFSRKSSFVHHMLSHTTGEVANE